MVKRTIELKIELESLNKEELDFHFIKNFKCQTEEEFKVFIKENAIAFDRLKFIKSRIRKIENELMSNKEKNIHLKYLEDLKNKFNDDSPI